VSRVGGAGVASGRGGPSCKRRRPQDGPTEIRRNSRRGPGCGAHRVARRDRAETPRQAVHQAFGSIVGVSRTGWSGPPLARLTWSTWGRRERGGRAVGRSAGSLPEKSRGSAWKKRVPGSADLVHPGGTEELRSRSLRRRVSHAAPGSLDDRGTCERSTTRTTRAGSGVEGNAKRVHEALRVGLR
jgi:hypothetical protein